ncbi:class I SAM-dependent methyltransferase [Tundrisphaera sp. TA3]|uniref:class I SAM-dependent methyltransferase n=1 Tax=Tundrisphaera sp. TA3 TaxID=3435775 RepID=UPI003EBE713E
MMTQHTPLSDFAAVALPGRSFPERGGIVEAMGPLSGRNRVAASFYDGPGWARFRFWERMFLRVQGGEARARRQILRHLAAPAGGRVLEVGIGDGANLRLIPGDWTAFGVDISRVQLGDCLRRHPGTSGRLALAESEDLPFADASFDACWTLGGFNYFRDHSAALREMARVTKPGGVMVVADEIPTLQRYGIGHLLGVPAVDAWWLRRLGLDRDFAAMVLDCRLDPDATIREAWPDAARHRIWGGLGYCFVRINDPLLAGDPR